MTCCYVPAPKTDPRFRNKVAAMNRGKTRSLIEKESGSNESGQLRQPKASRWNGPDLILFYVILIDESQMYAFMGYDVMCRSLRIHFTCLLAEWVLSSEDPNVVVWAVARHGL